MTNLKTLRKRVISQRKAISPEVQSKHSQIICAKILEQPTFKKANKIAFYIAVGGEISPTQLLEEALSQNKTCYLPVLHPLKHNELWFVRYTKDAQLAPNEFNILEPADTTERIPAWSLDVVLAPLVAFDKTCHRIGMGAGYYDRTFAFIKEDEEKPKPTLVGLAHDFQKVENIFPEPWDIPMDIIVTEENDYH